MMETLDEGDDEPRTNGIVPRAAAPSTVPAPAIGNDNKLDLKALEIDDIDV
jgi:hypothetical protein